MTDSRSHRRNASPTLRERWLLMPADSREAARALLALGALLMLASFFLGVAVTIAVDMIF